MDVKETVSNVNRNKAMHNIRIVGLIGLIGFGLGTQLNAQHTPATLDRDRVPKLAQQCLNQIDINRYHPDVERAVEQVRYAALNKYGEEVGIGAIADVNPQLAGLINRSRDIFENTGVSGYGEIARHYSDPSINHFPINVDIPATCYDPLLGYITDKK